MYVFVLCVCVCVCVCACVYPLPLSWLSEISGAVHLALLGLMEADREADQMQVNFKSL